MTCRRCKVFASFYGTDRYKVRGNINIEENRLFLGMLRKIGMYTKKNALHYFTGYKLEKPKPALETSDFLFV